MNKVLKPQLRFKGFTDPWEQRKVTEIGKIFIGLVTTMTKHYTNVGTLLIRNSDIKDGKFEFGNEPIYLDRTFAEQNTSRMHQIGDVITVHTGDVGTSAVIAEEQDKSIGFATIVTRPHKTKIDSYYLSTFLNSEKHKKWAVAISTGDGRTNYNLNDYFNLLIPTPKILEQQIIASFFCDLNKLITLHQRKHYVEKGVIFMLDKIKKTDLFYQYYAQWIAIYKEGAIRDVTMDKYRLTEKWLEKLIPQLQICEMNRINYQQLLNDYAKVHERQTTMDFHHQLKAAIMDAVDEELIETDPTRKAIVKGRPPHKKKPKFLNHYELQKLLECLDLHEYVNWDWFLLLVAKTGMRFSEALALLPTDFDFSHQMLIVSKTWNYKGNGGFLPTKNKSSVRKIQLDWQTVIQFSELIKNLPKETPIFIKHDHKIYNSTVNGILARHCKKLGIPIISIHGLRHTHASLLLFAGVSIASVARRLGHSSMTTTQKTYLHIIQELENKDVDLIMRSLSGLNN